MKNKYSDRREVYSTAISRWGKEAQMWMVVEEFSELLKEMCKERRGKRDPEAIADEIADSAIMLEQLCMIFDIEDAVREHIDRKIARLRVRLCMVEQHNE